MSKFPWGMVIDTWEISFDGETLEVVKYHPWEHKDCTRTNRINTSETRYYCQELHESAYSIQYLVIAWIAHKNLGLNEGSLVRGIARALNIGGEDCK